MSKPPTPSFARRCCGLLSLALLALALPARAVTVDLNTDGASDIWALKYGVTSFSPTADTDGDGVKDAAEAAAGTNPFSANSTVRIAAMTQDENGQHFTFPTLLGKGYVLQKSGSLSPAVWQAEGGIRKGIGADLTVTIPAAGAAAFFYRVVVQDVDTDADGVNDWEEMTLGFDPDNAYSNGLSAANDLARITQALGAANVVTVAVSDSSAVEPAVGAPATQTGAFEIRRTGNLNAITVAYTVAGSAISGTDYQAVTGLATLGLGVNSATVMITPLADAALESPESVLLTVSANAAYTVGTPATAALLIEDKATANGTGINARFWNNTSGTIPVFSNTSGTTNGSATPRISRVDAAINNNWGSGSPSSGNINNDYFVARFSGEILPEFSQVYRFTATADDRARLWVNGQLVFSHWTVTGPLTNTIELVAGQRVPIVLEYQEFTGNALVTLSWQSTNQPVQIIPQNRLFPTTPPQIVSALELLLIKDSPATTYQILASGEPTLYAASNLPPGWTLNATTGLISGTPNVAGVWPVVLTATNAQGSGSAILEISVIATGGGITRDVWAGNYSSVAELPLTTPPSGTGTVSALEGPLAPGGGDYGARLRGTVTAPQTGIYKFWITGSNSAELWISDDDEPVNLFRRAVTTGGTGHRQWSHANAGKSPLLRLEAGRRYAVEVRHTDPAADGHVSVGWIKPSENGSDPANVVSATEVVPGYALSPYVAPAIISGESTLFATSMTAQGGAVTSGYGSASLRLSADETQAVLSFTHANLTTPLTGQHIHSGVDTSIIFDIDTATPNADGSFTWQIVPSSPFSVAQIRDQIKTGNTYINIHTVFYPAGEIKGYLKLQAASQTFTAPPAQTWTDPVSASSPDSYLNRNAASRFLVQSTFGSSDAEILSVQALGFEGWIDQQINPLSKPMTGLYPYVFTNRRQTDLNGNVYVGSLVFNAWWRAAVTAPDQLRQRVAFALSEILVVSHNGPLDNRADTISDYYDMLLTNAFGNVRTLLEDTTLHPAMGRYLDMLRNDKPDKASGRIPNENYAREIKQLFSIGLYRMHPDGSLILNSKGELIPTYDQDAIIGFAHVFTGWDYAYTGGYRTGFGASENWLDPMREVPVRHFTGQKRLLNNVVLPGLAMLGTPLVPLDPYASHSSTQYNDPAYQALAGQEMDAAHDALFNHPNIAPFLCRQLIQRLVTSTPSRGYIYRVVQKFENNGSGVRGDMVAIVKAILLDHEARSATLLVQQGYGKQREPIARIAAVARAFPAPPPVSGTYAQTGNLITVNTGSTPHLFSNNQTVFLDFSGGTSGDPDDAAYAIASVTTTPPFTFTARPLTSESDVTYSQTGGTITVNYANDGHTYNVGNSLYLDFTTGTPSTPPDGYFTVVTDDTNSNFLQVNMPSTKTATYSQVGNVVTFTSTAHGFTGGQSIYLDFITGTPSLGTDGTFLVETATLTANTFTVNVADAVSRTGSAYITPTADAVARTGAAVSTKAAYAVTRTGNVAVNYSDWTMDDTDTDLNQTPLNSPTVFNYFLPDYQYPGILGAAGMITPEFQLTSETSVIRQANFLYAGIFQDGLGQRGLSNFRGGGRDIFFDLRPWMGIRPGGSNLPWTHNDNLDALIDELNTLLMAGQLDSTGTNNYTATPRVIQNARDAIRNYVLTQAYGKTISALTSAPSPNCQITANGHGLTTGQSVIISGITGSSFTPAINGTFTVTVVNANQFTVGVARASGGTTLSLTGASVAPVAGYPDVLRDRLRSIVHLLITSPDFTIQK